MSRWVVAGALLLLAVGAREAPAQSPPPRLLSLVEVLDGGEEEDLRWPVAVAAGGGAEARIAVAEANRPRLVIFRRIGASWALEGAPELPAAPVGVAWSAGRWVVSLRGPGGLLLLEPGGEAAGALALPEEVVPGAVADGAAGELLLWDAADSRVLRLDPGGRVAGSMAVGEIVTALAADGAGGVLVAAADRGRILRFDRNGRQIATWELPGAAPIPAWPAGIAAEPGGRIFVTDRHGARILVLDLEGRWIGLGSREGWDPGLLRLPAGIALLGDGGLAVVDQGNGRIQIFRPTSGGPGS